MFGIKLFVSELRKNDEPTNKNEKLIFAFRLYTFIAQQDCNAFCGK